MKAGESGCWKGFNLAGRELNRITNFKVWQEGSKPKVIETNKFLEQKLNYIHNNPVEDYVFSSASDYAGEKGLLAIEFV